MVTDRVTILLTESMSLINKTELTAQNSFARMTGVIVFITGEPYLHN